MRFILLFLISFSIQAQIQLGSNFSVNTALPIDNRFSVANTTARDALDSLRRYEGLIVYVVADGIHYALVGGITNSNWQPIGGGGGGIAQWQALTSYSTGDVVWLADDNLIYRALSNFTSGASFNPLNWQQLAGNVNGPASVTDNRIARFDGTTGKLIQESDLELTDAGNIRHTNGGFNILASTTDGADSSNTSLWGGGGTDITRGSGISTYGNEHATFPGVLRLKSGNAGSISMECNGVECFDADAVTGKLTLGASAGTQTHGVNGQLNVIANSATDAGIAVTQSGLANALKVDGDSTQTGAASITGSLAVDNIAIDGNEISSTDINGNISLNPNGIGEVVKIDDNGNSVKLGANPQALNLLRYPSFEEAISEATCASCTASQQTTGVMATPNNTSFLRAAFLASTGNVIVCGNSSNVDGVQGKASGWIKTDQADVVVYPRIDSVDISSLSKPVSSDGEWRYYEIPVPMGATNACLKVEATSSITGNVDIDDVFVGAAKVTAELGIQTATALDSGFTFEGLGTVSNVEVFTSRDGDKLVARGYFKTGTVAATIASIVLPSKYTLNLSAMPNGVGSSSRVGEADQLVSGSRGTASKMQLFVDGVTSNKIFFSIASDGTSYTNSSGTGIYANNQGGAFEFEVPIAEWSATTDIYSSSAEGSNVRLDTANGYGLTATKIRRFTNERVNFGSGIEYVDSATDGASFTARTSGFYFAQYDDNFNGSGVFGITKNASSLSTNIQSLVDQSEVVAYSSTSAANLPSPAVFIGWLWAGDVLRPHSEGLPAGNNARTKFSIVSFSDLIIGLFKDVVTSPGSSNGKPVKCEANLNTNTGSVTNITGNCFTVNSFVTAGKVPLNIKPGYFSDTPICGCSAPNTDDDVNGLVGCGTSISVPTTNSLVTFITKQGATRIGIANVSIWCTGLQP